MNPKDFDHLLKGLFNKHTISVDKDEMWHGVLKKLDKKKRRQRALLFFFLVGIISFASFLFDTMSPYSTSLSEVSSTHQNSLRSDKNENASRVFTKNQPSLSNVNYNSKKEKGQQRILNSSSSPITNVDNSKLISYSSSDTTNNSLNKLDLSNENINPSKNLFPDHPILDEIKVLPVIQAAIITSLDFIRIRLAPLFYSVKTTSLAHPWSIGFNFSVGQHTNNYGHYTSNIAQTYKLSRSKSEQSLEFLRAGVSLQKNISKHFFFRSGLNVFKRTDLYTDTVGVSDKRDVSTSYSPYIGTNVIGKTKQTLTFEEKQKYEAIYRVYNDYAGLQIPAFLGYSSYFGKNAIQIGLGLSLNYRFYIKGFTTYNYVAVPLNTFNYYGTQVYSKNLYLSAMASLRYEHQYTPKTTAFAGILADKTLGNILNSKSGLWQGYHAYSFEAGFRYIFR